MYKIKDWLKLLNSLMALVKPLKIYIIFAIFFGSIGHIIATFIPSVGMIFISKIILKESFDLNIVIIILVLLAIIRSLFKYLEQLLNHYVAFRTLAIIRDLVFKALRKLAPAKFESKNKGELISIITSDIELLEVFYAHTISPVGIAIIHSSIFFIILYRYNQIYAYIMLFFHLILGIIVPIITEQSSRDIGIIQRKNISNLNTNILETFKGIKEIINFSYGDERLKELNELTENLNKTSKILSKEVGKNISISNTVILLGTMIFIIESKKIYISGSVNIKDILVPIVIFISSFGPTSALSALSNNLILTLACGRRVMKLLNESPIVDEVTDGIDLDYENIELDNIKFSYDKNNLIDKFSLSVKKNEIIGVCGKSGSGKSTIMKLIMRFFDVNNGSISLNNINIKEINTKNLRENISYISQETHLFKGTIRDNLMIAKIDATDCELVEATKKASIYDFIMNLPDGFDTEIVNDKSLISTGQIQRLAIARMFLRDSKLYILDEPTANIDALNEAIILKSLYEERIDKTMIISSHRESTFRIANSIINVKRNLKS